jgi:carbon-monoxide dehydrogenase large subunit
VALDVRNGKLVWDVPVADREKGFTNTSGPIVIKGKVVQGLARCERFGPERCYISAYDAETGQLLTGTLMDYTLPRSDDLPSFDVALKETPCTHNPLGVKGCGEAGAIGAPAAVMNAITDALGIRDLPMPATPQTVWRAIRSAPQARAVKA